MRMKPDDYEYLRSKIEPLDTEERRIAYRQVNLTARRYRWDMFWESKVKVGDEVGIIGDINDPELNDEHIDTALRKICGMDQNAVIPRK